MAASNGGSLSFFGKTVTTKKKVRKLNSQATMVDGLSDAGTSTKGKKSKRGGGILKESSNRQQK